MGDDAAGVDVASVRARVLSPPTLDAPPRELDKAAFAKRVTLRALRIAPQKCKKVMGALKRRLLNIPRFRNIVDDPAGGGRKLVLLCPSVRGTADLAEAERAALAAEGVAIELVEHEVELGFDYWTTEQVLRAALPGADEITTSFETVGHIAHMNLRDAMLPHKALIGRVVLEKNRSIRTVVNKTSTIDTVYRFFKMELLAGEPDYVATVRESGCTFRMQYDKVYWNSRLHTEHDRVVGMLSEGDVVLDLMAGIGPFALPAAKGKRCRVYANDLNPASYAALVDNIALNKVGDRVVASNLDAREFVRAVLGRTPPGTAGHPPAGFHHAVMNLPASATEFLDVFRGLLADRRGMVDPDRMPTIHCYCFSKAEDWRGDAVRMCEAGLRGPIDPARCAVHEVRDVAPRKRMLCVSFSLPPGVAFAAADAAPRKARGGDDGDADASAGAGGTEGGAGPPPSKRPKVGGA